jgi:hypothetical protein
MAALVGSWSLAVLATFIVIVRPWRPGHAWPPLALAAAVAVASWALWDGAAIYADLTARHSWTAATITIPYVPAKALLFAVLAYFAVRSLLALRAPAVEHAGNRYAAPAILTGVTLFFLVSDVVASFEAARVRMARDPNLSTAQLNVAIARVGSGAASEDEVLAFLENPLCPPELLERYATETPLFKTYVARNPKVPVELVRRLSRDSDPTVRLHAAYSANLPAEELPRLAADTDELVRESIAWKAKLSDEDFARLITDTAPRVRSVVALQPRLSNEAVLQLTMDPDSSVRANATRIAVQRGIQQDE